MSGFRKFAIQALEIAMIATCPAFSPFCFAQSGDNAGKSSGQVTLLPNLMEENNSLSIHLPGDEYSAGSGWWALACPGQCELYPVTLTSKPLEHPVYDGDPVPGQVLSLAPVPPVSEVLIAINPSRMPQLKLNAGVVTTYYPGPMPHLRRPKTPGTMEAEVGLPEGRVAQLIPIVISEPKDKSQPEQHGEADIAPTLSLELQMEGRRQILGTFTFGIEGSMPLRPRDYVIWAGDLDGDSKPDFLLNFGFDQRNRALFLSSLAREGEIVGEAGRFQYYPIDAAGC